MRLLLAATLVLPVSVFAQELVFEVASVKTSQPGLRGSSIRNNPGRFETQNTTLHELIRYALPAQDFQLIGGPGWIKTEHFDINARNALTEDATVNPSDRKGNEARMARVRARLLHLLEDRFKLELREEQREAPVYALEVDKKTGVRMKAVDVPLGNVNQNSGDTQGSISGQGLTMVRLSDVLSSIVQRPVIDETDLAGAYDVELKYSPDLTVTDAASAPKDLPFPSLFTAIREQLGLHLTGKKGMAKVWVVVKAEKPEEN